MFFFFYFTYNILTLYVNRYELDLTSLIITIRFNCSHLQRNKTQTNNVIVIRKIIFLMSKMSSKQKMNKKKEKLPMEWYSCVLLSKTKYQILICFSSSFLIHAVWKVSLVSYIFAVLLQKSIYKKRKEIRFLFSIFAYFLIIIFGIDVGWQTLKCTYIIFDLSRIFDRI